MIRLIRASDNYLEGLSLVAEQRGRVIGHTMLSYVRLEDNNRQSRILTLSPLAVEPHCQNHGVGSQLVREALRQADGRGEPLTVLEGRPGYYHRFGFRPAADLGIAIKLPDWAPPEAAMALPLSNYDPKSALNGKVVYPKAFEAAEH
jgi:putative acetyltransferase